MFRKRGFENNRGQVTIFIIIAILVIALAVLAYFLIPNLRQNVSTQQQSPTQYIDNCMREKIMETIETTALQGGVYNIRESESYFYEGDHIKYHCYTGEYFKPCVVQYPLLTTRFENEIINEIEESSKSCFDSMVESFENQGYTVQLSKELSKEDINVDIIPERTVIRYDDKLTLTKGDAETYENFQIVVDNNIYQILGIASSIVEWEEEYGEAPVPTYMNWYHNLKIEKKLQLDGTNIYIITDRETGDKFQFASRSLVLPPGY